MKRATGWMAAILWALGAAGAEAQFEGAAATPTSSRGAPIIEVLDLEQVLRGSGRGLTSDEVAAQALRTAPSVAQSRAQLEQARAGASQAYLAFFPRLELTARYTRLSPVTQGSLGSSITSEQESMLRALIASVSDPAAQTLFTVNLESQLALANYRFPVLLNSFSFGGTVTVPLSDMFFQVLPSYEGAERAVEAQRAQQTAAAAQVSLQAREAFYNYARARAALAVASSTVATIEAQERVVQAAVGAGATARVDLLRLQAQLASARVAVQRATGGVETAAAALRSILHTTDEGEILIAEDLLAPLPVVEGDRNALIARAYEERAEIRALRAVLQARDRQIEAAEGSRYPHLVLQGSLAAENPNQRIFPVVDRFTENWSLTALIQWSPNDFFAGDAAATQQRAARVETEASLSQLEDGLRIQVTQAYETYRAAQLALDAARAGIDAAAEGVRVRTEQYRAGAGLITELMAATADLARAQLDLISAAIDARIAYAQLRRATATDGPFDVE